MGFRSIHGRPGRQASLGAGPFLLSRGCANPPRRTHPGMAKTHLLLVNIGSKVLSRRITRADLQHAARRAARVRVVCEIYGSCARRLLNWTNITINRSFLNHERKFDSCRGHQQKQALNRGNVQAGFSSSCVELGRIGSFRLVLRVTCG